MVRIAICADFFAEQYQTAVIRACMSRVRASGGHPTVFSGGYLNKTRFLMDSGNQVYELARKGYDGMIILGGTLSALTSGEDVRQYFTGNFNFPMVSISAPLPGIPSVGVDNYHGMRMVADHMVRKHGYRKFAFLRKQDGHFEGEERLRALQDVLEQVGTPLDEGHIIPGRYYSDNERGIQWLLEEQGLKPGIDLDALVCADTWSMMSAQRALQARGIRVPEDLALASFDHVFEHSLPFEPTCAAQPLDLMAGKAVEILYRLMAGEKVPEVNLVPSQFINGTSCGCPEPLKVFRAESQADGCRDIPSERNLTLIQALEFGLSIPGTEETDEEELAVLIHGGVDEAPAASGGEDPVLPVLPALQSGFNSDRLRQAEIRFRNLGRIGLRITGDDDLSVLARRVIDLALHETWENILELKIDISLKRRETDQKIRETLAYAYAGSRLEGLLWQFFGHLQYLRIPNAAIMLVHSQGKPYLAGTILKGNISCPVPGGAELDTSEFLNRLHTASSGGDALLITPLVYEDFFYGCLATELPLEYWEDFYVFDTLRLVLSGSVHGSRLQEDNERGRQAIQEAQERMLKSEKYVTLGSLVAGIAHEVNNPLGIALTAADMLSLELTSFLDALSEGSMTRSGMETARGDLLQGVKMVNSACRKAADIMAGFKQLSVDQTSERVRHFPFRECLDDVLLSMKPSFKPTRIVIETRLPLVLELETQAGALSQILTNCLMNSLVHGFDPGQDGIVSITASGETGKEFVLEYRDTGKGIRPEDIKKHFDPFYTTRRNSGGSGLGTSIIHSLVTERFGGSITLESSPGKGLHYRMVIPDHEGFRILLA